MSLSFLFSAGDFLIFIVAGIAFVLISASSYTSKTKISVIGGRQGTTFKDFSAQFELNREKTNIK